MSRQEARTQILKTPISAKNSGQSPKLRDAYISRVIPKLNHADPDAFRAAIYSKLATLTNHAGKSPVPFPDIVFQVLQTEKVERAFKSQEKHKSQDSQQDKGSQETQESPKVQENQEDQLPTPDLEILLETEWRLLLIETALESIRSLFTNRALIAFDMYMQNIPPTEIAQTLSQTGAITPGAVIKLINRFKLRLVQELELLKGE